jgi:hypothetical protein
MYVWLATTIICTVYLAISLPKIPYVHRVYIALANPICMLYANLMRLLGSATVYLDTEKGVPSRLHLLRYFPYHSWCMCRIS